MVHRVVVNQRREVDQLHHSRQRFSRPAGPTANLICEQEQGWAKQFASNLEQVVVDFGYGWEVCDERTTQLLQGGIEAGLNRRLNSGECRWGGMGGHVAAR